MSLWLVGSGEMAQGYSAVLRDLKQEHTVIGRGAQSAADFERVTGVSVIVGGLVRALQSAPPPASAIIAVGVESLFETAESLIRAGARRVLLEKPGGLDAKEIVELDKLAQVFGCRVYLGYNRRFYESVRRAQEIIVEDGGLLSAHFEFSEWGHKIAALDKDPRVLQRWLLANSSHVVDLAFYLCGFPTDYRFWRSGALDWHPTGARFVGAGVTDRNIPFGFVSDWEAPGRWGIDLMTKHHRIILRPLERLSLMQRGTVVVTEVPLEATLDERFKPGLWRQTEAFLSGRDEGLCALDEQARNVAVYSEMAGYPCGT